MDGANHGLVAEHRLVGLDADFQHAAVGVGRPAGIAVAMAHMGANHAERSLNLLCGSALCTLYGAALAGGDMYLLVVHLHRRQVGRSLDEVGNLAAHGQHAVGTGQQHVEQVVLRVAVDE